MKFFERNISFYGYRLDELKPNATARKLFIRVITIGLLGV